MVTNECCAGDIPSPLSPYNHQQYSSPNSPNHHHQQQSNNNNNNNNLNLMNGHSASPTSSFHHQQPMNNHFQFGNHTPITMTCPNVIFKFFFKYSDFIAFDAMNQSIPEPKRERKPKFYYTNNKNNRLIDFLILLIFVSIN